MKASFLFALVAPLFLYESTLAQQTQAPCSSTYSRKEIRSMSPSEWSTFTNTMTSLNNNGWVAWFSYIHTQYFNSIHGNSMFFPFHRRYIQDFERAGRGYNGNFFLPYWDSARDYSAPHNSAVLSGNYIGGNGGTNSCITNSYQSSLTITYPNSHCLRRNFNGPNGTIRTWYSPEYILSVVQRDNTMAAFRPDIEYSIHGAVHLGLGGDFSTTYSPNDVAFWLHHTNIDRLWWLWQNINNRMWLIDGPGPNGAQSINLDTNISYYNEPIRSVMQLGYGNMCYQYQGSSTSTSQVSNSRFGITSASPPSSPPNGGSESQVANGLENSLSDDVKSEFFPQMAGETSSTHRRRGPKKLMAKPVEMPKKWAQMHGFDWNEVQKCYKNAVRFVDVLNDSGYSPQYA